MATTNDSNQSSSTQSPTKNVDQTTSNTKPKPKKKPNWIIENLTSPRSLRVVARCWVATWANFLLMLPNRSLAVLGQAAFFGCMLTLMVPPSMPLPVFLIAFGMIAFGACIGWAWGAAAMAAANRARSQVILAAAIQRTQSSVATATNPEAQVQVAVFKGNFLDVRSTAVFGVFLILLCYFAAVVQVKLPKLKIATIFMLIVADIMCSYGPLFPAPRYSLATIFMIPIGCSCAICLACQILIFPESLAYTWQLDFIKMLRTTRSLIQSHADTLAHVGTLFDPATLTPGHEASEPAKFLRDSLQAEDKVAEIARAQIAETKVVQAALAEQVEGIMGNTAFLGMEFTYSYMNSIDMKSMFKKDRSASIRLSLLALFWKHLNHEMDLAGLDVLQHDQNLDKAAKDGDEDYDVDGEHGTFATATKGKLKPIKLHDSHIIHRARHHILESEAQQHVSMSRLLSILNTVTQPSLQAVIDCLKATEDYFVANSEWRARRPIDEVIAQLHNNRDALKQARRSLFEKDRFALFQPYFDHFQAQYPDLDIREHFLQTATSIDQFRAGSRPLHVCLVWVTNVLDLLDILIEKQDCLIRIADQRGTKKRVWWPKNLGKLYRILASKKGGTVGMDNVGSGDGRFDREEDIDQDFRQDRAHTAFDTSNGSASSSTDRLNVDEDDDESDDDRTVHQVDQEKATSAVPAAQAQSKKTKKTKASKKARDPRHYARDPDALPPTKFIHRIGRVVAGTYYFVYGPTGIFALRLCIASFAVWIFSVHPNTAYFAYQNRAIWALIMAQTGLALHGGEMVFTFAARIAGTVIGLLVGAVMWYISTGKGRGNAYGLAAVTAVGFFPMVFLRVWSPKMLLLPAIMTNVSIILIVGYSWINTHLAVLVNTGVGIEVAYKRALLVIIGMTVAFIVMIFPRPVSSRLLVRKSLAKSTRHLNELYISITELWIAKSRQLAQREQQKAFQHSISTTSNNNYDGVSPAVGETEEEKDVFQQQEPVLRAHFLACHTQISELGAQVGLASLDFQIRGRWPVERYAQLAGIQATILESLGALATSMRAFQAPTTSFKPTALQVEQAKGRGEGKIDWSSTMSSSTALMDPQFISEICLTFDLLSKALRNGERLNHCHFSLLENFFKYTYLNRTIRSKLNTRSGEKQEGRQSGKGHEQEEQEEEGVTDTILNWDVLHDPMYLRFSTARMAAITLVSQLDKFKSIVQDLVGQTGLRGFDDLKNQFDDRVYRAHHHRPGTVTLNGTGTGRDRSD